MDHKLNRGGIIKNDDPEDVELDVGEVIVPLNFKEMKARKNGEVTPVFLAENLEWATKEGRVEKLIYITVDDDGEIRCGWSNMPNTELFGLIEIAKQNIFDEFR